MFFPELFDVVYGVKFEIKYFPDVIDQKSLDDVKWFQKLPPSQYYNHIHYKKFQRAECLDDNHNKFMSVLHIIKISLDYDDSSFSDNPYKHMIDYMIKYRHLEEYWVQSYFLMKL